MNFKKDKLRILQISPQVPVPPIDGGKISIFGLLKSLTMKGHIIDFFCYRKHADYTYSVKELSKFCNPRIVDVQTDNNLLKAFINIFQDKPYNISKYIKEEMLINLKKYFNNHEPDIVHIDHIHMAWLIDYLRKFTTKPIVLREHNFESDILFRTYSLKKFPILKSYFYEQYNRLLDYEISYAEKFDKVIMISEVDEKKILTFNNKVNTITIPAGVDDVLFKYTAYKHSKLPNSIFHIGNLDWEPNLDSVQWFINQIFPHIVANFPDAKFYVYGKNSNRVSIPPRLKYNVKLVGFVPASDIWNEIKDKQVGVVPLRIGSGIRIKILELLAQGHLIISTDIGKEGIPIVDGVHYLRANSPEEFKEKIFALFNNHYNVEEICINAQEFIKNNYSWNFIVEQFEKLYFSLINDQLG